MLLKYAEMERKLNNLTEEVHSIKYAMNDEIKENAMSTDDITDEINIIKRQITKMTKTKKIINKKSSDSDKKKTKMEKKTDSEKSGRSSVKQKNVRNSKLSAEKMKLFRKRSEELKKWLNDECELSEYYQIFTQNGLDNLSIIQHVTITDLALLGVPILAHRVKIMQSVQKLKYREQQRKSNDLQSV